MMPATRRSALVFGCSALLLAGCISVEVGSSESNVRAQYRLADLAPPRVIWKREMISGSATVSMTTHFHATPDEMSAVGSRFVLSEVHCRRCEGGYFDHELRLWSPDGALLATSEQVAAFRD